MLTKEDGQLNWTGSSTASNMEFKQLQINEINSHRQQVSFYWVTSKNKSTSEQLVNSETQKS